MLISKSAINEKEANELMNLCQEYGLQSPTKSVYKALGKKYFLEKSYANAAICLRDSGDHERFQGFGLYLVELLDNGIDKHLIQMVFDSSYCLDNLADLEIPESLCAASYLFRFIREYQHLNTIWNSGEFAEFATKSINLLLSRIAPQQFWFKLLLDLVPLLESNPISFSHFVLLFKNLIFISLIISSESI